MVDWSEEPPDIATLKTMVTVHDVLEMCGIEEDGSGKFSLREERTPSAHAYEDHWYDFGTGEGGDIIDLVRALYPEATFNGALYRIWNRALKAGREPGDVEREAPRNIVDFTEEFNATGDGVLTGTLGLTLLSEWNIRINKTPLAVETLIPHQDQGGIYGVKVRTSNGKKSAWPGSQFTKRLYDPYGWGDPLYAVAVICEGESDCWALDRVLPYVEIYALPAGAGSWKDSWLKDLDWFEKVYLCMDNDHAGKQALDKLQRKIGWAKAEPLIVPQLYNDAREAVAAGWRPQL